MTNNHSKLYSETRAKPGSFSGTIPQTINLAPPYDETFRNLVNSGMACAISFINPNKDLQHLFAPVLLPQVDGSPSTTSLGNTSNNIGWLGPASVDFSATHFLALMSEGEMDQLGIPKPQEAIPQAVAEENALTGPHYLVAAPKVILGHFKLEFPTGPIDDVSEQYESNGTGYEAWFNLIRSALTPVQQARIKRIYEHPTVQAAPASFIRDMPNNIDLQGPATTATIGTFDAYPDQVKKIKEAFLPPVSNPNISSVNGAQVVELTTGADKQQKFTSDRGLMKIGLYSVGGKVDFDTGKIDTSTLIRPIETKSMEVIKKAPSGNRHEIFFDQVRCLLSELHKNGNVMNTLSNTSMTLLPSDACKLLLNGSLQTELLTDINDEKQLSSIGASTFMPQNSDDTLLAQYIQDEENERNTKSANLPSSVPKKLRVVLTSLDKVDERSAIKILINGRAVYLVLIDFEEMERRGTPAIFSQITLKVLDWLSTQVDRKNAAWKRAIKAPMPHLGFVYFGLTDTMFTAFANFSNSLHNQDIFQDTSGDLSKLDFSDITKFLKVFNSYREKFDTLQMMNAAHVDVPAIARGLVSKIPSVPTVSPSAADRQQRQQQQQQQQQPSAGRPNHNEQRASKKPKPNPPQPPATNNNAGGMLILYEGKEVDDAVPGSLNICPHFVAKGYSCPLGRECPKTHPFKLSTVPVRDRKVWCQHLRATKAGFFSQWRVKDADTSGPEYAGLIGNANNPPAQTEESVSQVRQQQTPFGADVLTSLPSKHYFSASSASSVTTTTTRTSHLQLSTQTPRNSQPVVPSNRHTATPRLLPPASTRLVRDTAHSVRILENYEATHRQDPSVPIVTVAQGKKDIVGMKQDAKVMPPRMTAAYRVENLNLELIILPVFASGFLDIESYESIALMTKRLHRLVPKHLGWMNLETAGLRQPRLDYAQQEAIQQDRVNMASAQFIRAGGDPGKLVRFCQQEYMLQHLNREEILARVKDLISVDDYRQMERILYEGCPAEFNYEESNSSRSRSFERGNLPTFTRNMDKVRKAMNKEDRLSHVIPVDEDLAYFSPYCRHTPQGAVDKPNKSFRIVWDGSTKQRFDDVMLNDVTPTDKEATITFGQTERLFDCDLYNLRVSYPDALVFLATVDVASCYKFPRIHPDLAGAFGFFDSQGFYHLATAMVFGSVVSANQWEPFRRTIEYLSQLFKDREDLVLKHRAYLDMIDWDEEDHGPNVQVKACKLCPGVLDEDGNEVKRPARFYVDDALIAAIGRMRMEKFLAATIEAIFCVMGSPDTARRRCALALDKLEKLRVGPHQILLGLRYDTINMTKGTTAEYRLELLIFIDTEWPSARATFTAHDMQVLVGKLARLAKGAKWVYHILSHSYDQIALALASNHRLLHYHSSHFRGLIGRIKKGQMGKDKLSQDSGRIVSFALKQASQLVHRSKSTHPISKELRADIEFFRWALRQDSGVRWDSPLAHIVPRTPIGIPYGDACLTGCGGYCVELKFWWHLTLPEEIVKRTLLHLSDDSNNDLISINALEFITVIFNYCAALTVLYTSGSGILQYDPFPVILCKTDNTSALSWVNHRCKGSALGRALGFLFVGLLMDSLLGINSEWLNTHDNEVADGISRFKLNSTNNANTVQHDTVGLSALVTELTPHLHSLSNINHQANSKSRGNQELGTERSRQSHYIAWCDKQNVKDPVGSDPAYKELVGCYLQDVIRGVNFNNQQKVRSQTVKGYANAVNELFRLRNKPLPYILGDKLNDSHTAITNLEDEETIAVQRSPLDDTIAAVCVKLGQDARPNSAHSLLANLTCIARYVGPRLSEYGQQNQKKITYHTWKSGNKVVRSWILQDFLFFDRQKGRINLRGRTNETIQRIYSEICYMTLTWRIQKNRRNGQSIKIPTDSAHLDICPVHHALQIVLRKFRIDSSNLDTPVCVFAKDNSTDPLYLTGTKVKEFLQKAVKIARPNILQEELKKFSAHSLRVWACVLLDQAGKSPSYIQQRLRWQGDSYRLYLRDTIHSSQAHCNALAKDSNNIISAISTSAEGTIDESNPYTINDMD